MRIQVNHIANLDGKVDLDGITAISGRKNAGLPRNVKFEKKEDGI